MTNEYRFETLADLAAYFEMMADRDTRSAKGTKTKSRCQILRESAHTWRSAASVIRNATILQNPADTDQVKQGILTVQIIGIACTNDRGTVWRVTFDGR